MRFTHTPFDVRFALKFVKRFFSSAARKRASALGISARRPAAAAAADSKPAVDVSRGIDDFFLFFRVLRFHSDERNSIRPGGFCAGENSDTQLDGGHDHRESRCVHQAVERGQRLFRADIAKGQRHHSPRTVHHGLR